MLSTSWFFFINPRQNDQYGNGRGTFWPPFHPMVRQTHEFTRAQAVGFVKWHTQQWNMSSSYEYFHGLLLFGESVLCMYYVCTYIYYIYLYNFWGYPYNGVRAYTASANIYYYWPNLYALSILVAKLESELKKKCAQYCANRLIY